MLFRLMLLPLGGPSSMDLKWNRILCGTWRKIPRLARERTFHLTTAPLSVMPDGVKSSVWHRECQKAPGPPAFLTWKTLSPMRLSSEMGAEPWPSESARLGPWANSKPHLTRRHPWGERERCNVPIAGSASWTRNSWPIPLFQYCCREALHRLQRILISPTTS